MAEFGFYSFSESFKPGIDFYSIDDAKQISASISITSSLNVNFTLPIRSALSIESNASITASRIVFASALLDIDGATLTVTEGIRLAATSLSGSVDVVANITKYIHIAASISIDSEVTAVSKEILNAQISISASSNVNTLIKKDAFASSIITSVSSISTIATKVQLISSALSGNVNLTVAGKLVLITIRIVVNNLGQATARAVKFIAGNVISASDLSDIRTVLLIDDKPITNHNRKLGVSVDPIFVENINWNNRKSRYYKSSARPARKTFNLSWSYVPNSQSHTVDGKRGRDYIREIAGKPQHHVLKIINMDENGNTPYTETSYNVLVKDYNETLVRRDLSEDIYFWDCSISLEEV